MRSTASRAREHQVVFCGLEVLRLIGERMESRDDVDGEDLKIVLGFMRDVAHRCLDNTEELLRAAALEQSIINHGRARSLFDELIQAAGTSGSEQFALICRQYTTLVADVIYDDRRCVASLSGDYDTLGQFYEWEREIAEIERRHAQALHHLELKYTSPHCI
jgi:hypothetical protein